jgi:hypothetical protein
LWLEWCKMVAFHELWKKVQSWYDVFLLTVCFILVPEVSTRSRRLRHWLPLLQPEIGSPLQCSMYGSTWRCRVAANFWLPKPSSPSGGRVPIMPRLLPVSLHIKWYQ